MSGLPEQNDMNKCGIGKRAQKYKKYLKDRMVRFSRRNAKNTLKKEEQPDSFEHKYKGWAS